MCICVSVVDLDISPPPKDIGAFDAFLLDYEIMGFNEMVGDLVAIYPLFPGLSSLYIPRFLTSTGRSGGFIQQGHTDWFSLLRILLL